MFAAERVPLTVLGPRSVSAHVAAPTTEAAKNVYGLIVGINDYPGTTSDLQGAVPDAEDMSDVLAMYGVPAPMPYRTLASRTQSLTAS